MNEQYLERECDAPDGWVNETILQRDGRGRVFEIAIPDDEEGGD